jgi:hypothetical protein
VLYDMLSALYWATFTGAGIFIILKNLRFLNFFKIKLFLTSK